MASVFLNPGHDIALDSGAVNEDLGIRECDIAMSIGALVADYLEDAGITVYSCQQDNLAGEAGYEYNDSVCAKANESDCDLFVSIHCNAADNLEAQGTECLVFSVDNQAEQAAQCIQSRIITDLDTVDRGVKVRSELIVLKDTSMPSVLVETGFISNYSDALKLLNNKEDFAKAITYGIIDYFAYYA